MLPVRVRVQDCPEDCILAEDVFNPLGTLLLRKNTIIDSYVKCKLFSHNIHSVLISPSIKNEKDKGIILQATCMYQVKKIISSLVAGKPLKSNDLEQLSQNIFQISFKMEYIQGYLKRLKQSDDYTYTHSLNVGFYAMLLAEWLKLPSDKVKRCIKAGVLHDVGKIKISYSILTKKGKLTKAETEKIKNHSLYGYEMLHHENKVDEDVKKAVLLHHERNDGSGYPYGINYQELNDIEQIIAIADVYDAMTSDRVYKKGKTPFEAFEELITLCRGPLNEDMLNTFVHRLAPYYTGIKVLLNNGTIADVIYVPPHNISKPIIKYNSIYRDLSIYRKDWIEKVIF
ncbi:MAG: HD-GYP domain-containing protein [Clostridia bacterium]|nr:HD-GYP domain-containing protein [Clostridia bacterium]